jgi:hypothetical protein
VRVGRRFVVICLGNQRHVRCDGSFLRKLATTDVTIREAPDGPLASSPSTLSLQNCLLPE